MSCEEFDTVVMNCEGLEPVNVNGEVFHIPVEVKDTLDGLLNSAEGFRVDVCAILGIDYLEASDQDMLDAIKSLKKGDA